MCGEAKLWTKSMGLAECLGQGFPLKDFSSVTESLCLRLFLLN